MLYLPYTLCSIADDHVVLESVQYRGQHVGILPDGTVKEPGRTGTGKHAQFILSTITTNTVSYCSWERIINCHLHNLPM